MNAGYFGTEKISKILFRLAPPVMLAQLIQALYNIVDSLFVAKYSESGLTALSIIYPIQLLMIAVAVGTGVGINTVMASKLGIGIRRRRNPSCCFSMGCIHLDMCTYNATLRKIIHTVKGCNT